MVTPTTRRIPMNATDILTEILHGGRRGKPSSPGGGVFKDIFRGGRSEASPPAAGDIEAQARELEDMLGVGRSKPSPSPASTSASTSRTARDWGRTIPPASAQTPPPLPGASGSDPSRQEAEAQVLIRAMISAARADGRLSADEQNAILERLGGASREAIAFLRRELNTSLDVRDFAWSVPLGMECKVYTISLAAIDLDTRSESEYLEQLAHGLRLSREVRARIHQRYGIPAP